MQGLAVGLALALAGAILEYWLGLRNRNSNPPRQLPGCLLYVAGGLALAGVVAVILSLILNGTVSPALQLGAGILGGFYIGFAILFLVYLLFKRFWPSG
jgi:hypothetical protein